MNKFKKYIKENKLICGTHISMGNTYVADIFSKIGFDYIWIDTEHSVIDYRELADCMMVIKAHKVPVIIRAQMQNFNHVKRIMEMGPDGIIFPNIDTVEQAKEIVCDTSYPPLGRRGFGPIGATSYGLSSAEDYIKENGDMCRFIQIESKTAVDNIETISDVPGIDGFIFGPCDLSATFGKLPDIFCEENLKAFEKVIKVLKSKGKYIGVSTGSCDEKIQRFFYDIGINMVTSGVDFEYVAQSALANFKSLKNIIKEKTEK